MGFCKYYTLHNNIKGLYYGNINTGYGELYYNNGSIYRGEWLDSKYDGLGIYYNYEFFYNGYWKNNLLHGHGYMIYPNMTIYNGYWKYDKKHGKGTLYTNNYILEGFWKNNQLFFTYNIYLVNRLKGY